MDIIIWKNTDFSCIVENTLCNGKTEHISSGYVGGYVMTNRIQNYRRIGNWENFFVEDVYKRQLQHRSRAHQNSVRILDLVAISVSIRRESG